MVKELEAYAAADNQLTGITRDEAIRHFKFHSRPERHLQNRAEIYAVNTLMREHEKHQFEEFIESDWWRHWSRSLLPNEPPPLMTWVADEAPPPYAVYEAAMDRAQAEYESVTHVSVGNARAICERERERELIPADLVAGAMRVRAHDRHAKMRGKVQERARTHESARMQAWSERHQVPLQRKFTSRALASVRSTSPESPRPSSPVFPMNSAVGTGAAHRTAGPPPSPRSPSRSSTAPKLIDALASSSLMSASASTTPPTTLDELYRELYAKPTRPPHPSGQQNDTPGDAEQLMPLPGSSFGDAVKSLWQAIGTAPVVVGEKPSAASKGNRLSSLVTMTRARSKVHRLHSTEA